MPSAFLPSSSETPADSASLLTLLVSAGLLISYVEVQVTFVIPPRAGGFIQHKIGRLYGPRLQIMQAPAITLFPWVSQKVGVYGQGEQWTNMADIEQTMTASEMNENMRQDRDRRIMLEFHFCQPDRNVRFSF